MLLKEIGRTGVSIAEIGIGTWGYHAGPVPLRKGLEAGALFIDTAESYGTEPVVGEAIKGFRGRVFVATKVSPEHFRARDLTNAADASLRHLGVDAIDLYQLHSPNPAIPIEETMGAAADLVTAGKVRFVGVSNFSVEQLRAAQQALGKHPIVSNQVRYNLVDRTIEKNLLGYCQENHISVIAYSPLARDLNRIRDCDPEGVLDQLVKETGKTAVQIIINWCVCKEGVIAIPKGNSIEHVLENCGSSDWRLSGEQLRLLDEKIRFRHRGRLDALLRRYMPGPLAQLALKSVKLLPKSLRRKIT